MNKPFSYTVRQDLIRDAQNESFDLIIIGGGITGAGIALDAALRGLKVVLVEKDDFASGTSSRSTKLIHGGLRYLKQLEFGLVKEVGSERAIVHKLAPHLVVPEKMLLPLYEKRGLGYWLTSIGLKIYDWLAGVLEVDQRKMLTRKQTLRQEPLLNPEDVKGGAIYAEYRTDDARLTIEIIKSAYLHGAKPLSYCKVSKLMYEQEKISGVEVLDVINSNAFSLKANAIVNAAGPWVDELREMDHSKKGKRLHLTKGVHLVVCKERLPIHQAIYFDVEDGRMIFAIPRGRTTYIGTTDTNYEGSKEEVLASGDDATYLVNAVNRTFPQAGLTVKDIESSWAGLRPLIHEEGKSASELSRKDEIFVSNSGLISIAGGKLTGYRKMAERIIDLVFETHFEDRHAKCQTATTPFVGSDFDNYQAVRNYTTEIASQLKPFGLDNESAYLVGTYGRQCNSIVDYFLAHQTGDTGVDLLQAEIWFCIHFEMVVTLPDFVVRRTGMLYFNMPRLIKYKENIIRGFRQHLNWNNEKIQIEAASLEHLILNATNFN
ncbi:MAG: glycerol-3-phosphate dehydrogenase/oxidase [Bacteroidetes bacterium]|nr:glycerol-3-phosphate dehydrogenase/oxidase [Bacteroidota bacterium]